MPTLYSGYDAGTSNPNGASGEKVGLFNYLVDVLTDALVNGYGAKPAAGWTRTHYIQGVTVSFRPPSQDFVVTLVNLGGTSSTGLQMRLFMSESVTTYPTSRGANSRPIGYNVRSGYYSADSNPSGACQAFYTYSLSRVCWSIVADAETFAFALEGFSNDNGNGSSYLYHTSLFVGKSRSTIGMSGVANAMAIGGTNTSSLGSTTPGGWSAPWGTGSTYLRSPLTGLIVNGGMGRVYTSVFDTAPPNTSQWSEVVPTLDTGAPEIELVKVGMMYGGIGHYGYVKGVAACPAWLNYYYSLYGVQALGLLAQYPGTSQRWNWYHRPVCLPDGYYYCLGGAATYPYLLTDNPDFW